MEKSKQVEKNLGSLVKRLTETYQRAERPKVSVFYGLNGVKNVFEDVLKSIPSGHELIIFPALHARKLIGTYADQWHARRKAKGFSIRTIFDPASESMKRAKEFLGDKTMEIRYFKEPAVNPVQYFVFENKVAIISFVKGERLVVIIEDKKIADLFRQKFEALWENACSTSQPR